MSLQHLESFMSFDRHAGDDSYTTENTTARNNAAAALKAAGYDVFIGANAAIASSSGFVVRNDPVFAERAALAYSSGKATPNGAATTPSAAIRKRFPTSRAPLIGGFGVYVPNEYVRVELAAGTYNVFAMYCPPGASTSAWQGLVTPAANATAFNQAFVIATDLRIRFGADAAQSDKFLEAGRINYIEFRLTDNEIRVWLDGILVLQKNVQLLRETIALGFFDVPTQSTVPTLVGPASKWAISNMYFLREDANAPNVRLGPTTRVIGARPTADVSTTFTRPAGAASNAAVAAQSVSASPALALQSSSVGAQDIYSTTGDTQTAAGAVIHAVAVKVMAASLDGSTHAVRPVIRTAAGTEVVDKRPSGFQLLPTLPGGAAITGLGFRRTDGVIFAITANAIYKTPPNGDGKSWTLVSSDTAANNLCIKFRDDGFGVIGRSNGTIIVINPAGDVTTVVTPTGSSGTLAYITVSRDGRFVLVGVPQVIRLNAGNPSLLLPGSWARTAPFGSSPLAGITRLRDGRVVVSYANTTGIAWTSDDSGATWIQRAVGTTQTMNAIASDGDRISLVGIINRSDAFMRKSNDGVVWEALNPAVAPFPNTGAYASIAVSFGEGDDMGATSTGVIFGGANGSVLYFAPAGTLMYWPEMIGNAAVPRAATITANGQWIIGGDAGLLMSLDPLPVDQVLPPFSGFVSTFNSAAFNPDTGAPWTPAEAAATQFGIRVTS